MGWPAPREVFEVGCRRSRSNARNSAPALRSASSPLAAPSPINPAGRLTADELANLIPAVERYAEVETEQFANLPNSSLTVEGSVGCVRVAIVLRLLRWWVHEEHYEPRPLKRVGVPIRRDLQAFQTTH